MPSILNATTTSGLVTSADNSGSLQLQTNNGTTAVTIDTSQNVGIGTNAPTYQVEIKSTDPRMALNNSNYGTWFSSAGWTGANDYSVVQAGTAERFRLSSAGNLMFNSGYGSVATAYGCRAWCSLNGTGTIAIRGSGNISSVTDLGTGNYQFNFATAMPDANYGTSYSDYSWGVGYTDNFTTTYFRSQTLNSSFGALDTGFVQVAVFR